MLPGFLEQRVSWIVLSQGLGTIKSLALTRDETSVLFQTPEWSLLGGLYQLAFWPCVQQEVKTIYGLRSKKGLHEKREKNIDVQSRL